ncbi:hypothetical protein CRI70_13620 [Streptomyces sp. Ru87]|nr:hypothetical protein CRI70_13620 [Streptomyces sp. Ru87]
MLVVGAAGTAQAANVYISRAGASGSADWDWEKASLTDVDYTVKDTKCDANDVYIRMRVYTALQPDGIDTSRRYNSDGCGTSKSHTNLSFHASNNISGLRVYVCVDDAGSDSCTRSSYIDNPDT